MKPLRILVVDDSQFFRDSAVTLLSTFDGVEIVGPVASAGKALEKVKGDTPDLVLMDISMPHMSGFAATARIKELPNAPRVVLVTLHDRDDYRAAAKAAGADRFVLKERFPEAIRTLIAEHSDVAGGRRAEAALEIAPAR